MASVATFRLGLSTSVRPLWKPPHGYIQTLFFWETPSLVKLTMKINLLGQEFSEELTRSEG